MTYAATPAATPRRATLAAPLALGLVAIAGMALLSALGALPAVTSFSKVPTTTCTCKTPGSTKGGENGYKCSDGASGHCASDEYCHAETTFVKGQWSDGCKKPATCTCKTPGSAEDGENDYTCSDGASGHCASDDYCHAETAFDKGQWSDGCAKKPECHCTNPCIDVSGTYDKPLGDPTAVNSDPWYGGKMTQDGCNLEWYPASCDSCKPVQYVIDGNEVSSKRLYQGTYQVSNKVGILSGNEIKWFDDSSPWERRPGSNNQGGKNGYTCTDGASGHCASDEYCYAKEGFVKGQWSDGCIKNTATAASSPSYNRCGPIFGGKACSSAADPYCNDSTGWCGSSDAHKTNSDYDFGV